MRNTILGRSSYEQAINMRVKGKVRFIGVVEDAGKLSRVRIFPEFCAGLQSLGGFSHVIILYWFHLRDTEEERRVLQVTPRRHPGSPQVGVFASRSPSRPNPVGLCIAELVRIQDCTLFVRGLDAMESSPVIDIKPYIPRADCFPDAKVPEWTSRDF